MAALQRLEKKQIKALLDWFSLHQRDFPWRKNPEPYWVWLAEIMSQQTQMATLVPYFKRFVERFPTIQDLANSSEQDVLSAWTGLGYYSRARNVLRAAELVVNEHGASFPETFEGWLELPGVGPYTAAAVVSQCFGIEEPVWDGNVQRVCSRLDARKDVWTQGFRAEFEQALREKIKGWNASSFNQALMELGATVCTPKQVACHRCPLQKACSAFSLDQVAEYPPAKPRKAAVELKCKTWVQVKRIDSKDAYVLLMHRPSNRWFGGMWDFLSELGGVEDPVVEIPGFRKSKAILFSRVRHNITHHKIALEGWVSLQQGLADLSAQIGPETRWIKLSELTSGQPPVPLSTTARKLLPGLLAWVDGTLGDLRPPC
ncbi:MAG: A/G-specific adenine glycosylase [Bdellovibrionota bacterium]